MTMRSPSGNLMLPLELGTLNCCGAAVLRKADLELEDEQRMSGGIGLEAGAKQEGNGSQSQAMRSTVTAV
ncbi:hypothetical protein NDU88_007489 [Pleurodeles waltl]|uniref:Uncharacterized protein n=1 Tax=Pleurodeles waltl TaxID=8319 RepID=A0AAV7RPL9_PLEWA|nr:hypothetical protein NDU88_007489 [Pleurodeles waltl]